MMSSLQSFSQERLGVNLFLAIDEEGGERLPLASANGYEAQQAPSQLEMLTQRAAVQER